MSPHLTNPGLLERREPPRRPCILLVDDDATFTALVGEALREDGFTVTVGASGRELVDHVRRALADLGPPIDLVISDVRMPNGSGLQALAMLASCPSLPPILLMTAFGDDDVRDSAVRLGAVGVISKPFDVDDLRTIVRELIEARR